MKNWTNKKPHKHQEITLCIYVQLQYVLLRIVKPNDCCCRVSFKCIYLLTYLLPIAWLTVVNSEIWKSISHASSDGGCCNRICRHIEVQ